MREGHLWGKKDVIIPVSAMGDTHDDTVFLTIDKHQVSLCRLSRYKGAGPNGWAGMATCFEMIKD